MDSEHDILEDRVARLLLSLSTLGDVGEALTATGNFSRTIQSLLRLALGVLTISKGAILLFDRERGALSVGTAKGLGRIRPTIRLEDEWVGVLAGEHRPLSRADMEQLLAPMVSRHAEQLDALQAYLWVPLVVRQELLGILSVSERFGKRAYTDEDLELLFTFARHISVGIYNHRLIGEAKALNFSLNDQVRKLETLHDVGMTITSVLEDVSELVDNVLLERMVETLDVGGGFLLLKEEVTGELDTGVHLGIEEEEIRRIRASDRGDLLAEVIGTGRSCMLNGIGEKLSGVSFRHLMLIPLKGGEETLGVLGVLDKESREGVVPFGEEDQRLAYSFANQAGIAVANARLYRGIRDARDYTQNVLTSISSGVISTDLEGRIESVNRPARRILGIEGDEMVGRSYRELSDRLNNDEIGDLIGSVLSTGVGEQATDLECRTDSRSLVMDVSVSPLKDQEESVRGLVIALEDLSEEKRIRDTFKQYVSGQVVDMLLETPPTLGGEERDVVVLFSDLRGYTPMLEKLGPKEVVDTLNEYYERMFDVVFRHDGTVKDMAGDGLMVLYGVPIILGDEMDRAIRTALDMREALHELNDQRSEAGKDPLGMYIGISTGRVLAGNIGSRRRMDYTVVGDAVNLAKRLVDLAASGQMLVCKDVYEQIKDRFRVEYLRNIPVYGKRMPVDIYELEGERGAEVAPEPAEEDDMKKKPSPEVDLTIPMLPEMEVTASNAAAAVAEFMKLEEEKIEEIKLALIEACLNAIEHSKSKDRKVYMRFSIHEDELEITIQDFGEGFDVEEIRKAIAERETGKLLKRGWGLQIMEGLMDDVKVDSSPKGTLIRMIKRR